MNIKMIATLVFFSCSVVIFLYIYFSTSNRDKAEIERTKSEYLRVEKSTDIDAFVKDIYCPNGIRWDGTVTFVTLDNSQKISVFSKLDVRNQIKINEIIVPGSHLKKEFGSDTLVISTKKQGFITRKFVLNG